MEAETRRKVEEMVLDILKKSKMEEATEFSIRVAASERLGIDLSHRAGRQLVRNVVESYLASVVASHKSKNTEKKEDMPVNEDVQKNPDIIVPAKEDTEVVRPRRENPERIICKLSDRRNIAVKSFKGTTLVSIREFYVKDGKLLPGYKGISLSSEQWSTFKKNVPAIEEAIKKMEGRIGLKHNGKQNGDELLSNPVVDVAPVKPVPNEAVDVAPVKPVPNEAVDVAPVEPVSNAVVDVAPVEPVPNAVVNVAPVEPVPNAIFDIAPVEPVPTEEVPIEVIRFDGKNYQIWAQRMELLLKQLKIEYVLTEPCPNPTAGESASAEKIVAAKAAEKRWLNDDLVCHRNILNHLSDHLFNLHANRKMNAKELWEELKLVYLYEEFGTKRSQVKKYIEFQMVEEKAVMEQIQELNDIADSIVAAGIFLDDNFHVSLIISKLPPSWKDVCIKLMREDYLPFWKLMERIQIEEESRSGVKRVGEHYNNVGFHLANRGGPRRVGNRPLGMPRNRSEFNTKSIPCSVCGKKGHLSKNCWRLNDKQSNE